MKTILATVLLAFSIAQASDLQNDLHTPFEPMTNPFNHLAEQKLNPNISARIQNLLEGCVVTPVKFESNVYFPAHVKSECAQSVIVRNKDENKLEVITPFFHLFVVSWDGSNSDGYDEQAMGIYDQTGKRVAIYPALYVDSNVLDGLAHAIGANLGKVSAATIPNFQNQ